MRNTRRLSTIAAAAALAAVLSACGSEAPVPSGPAAPAAPAPPAAAPSAAAPSAAPGDGVTTAADTFGAACSALPKGDAPGSLDSMGPMPVASAAGTNPLLTTPTLAGSALQVKESGDTLTVTDASGQTATVLCGNIPTSNATVFVIDKVLMPKSTS